jgi:ribonuclease VapC
VTRAILDASALSALLTKEPGGHAVISHLPGSMLSAVNLSEVVSKTVETGISLEETRDVLTAFPCEIVPFDEELAYLAACLRATTRPFGLSFGDRACLALGLKTGSPVVTADRVWSECDVGVRVIQIR